MSTTVKDTLRTMIDRNVASYIDEVAKELIADKQDTESKLRTLVIRVAALEEKPVVAPSEGKEMLTKTKLIRLMKEMGYYE
jgi:hypothetical protein